MDARTKRRMKLVELVRWFMYLLMAAGTIGLICMIWKESSLVWTKVGISILLFAGMLRYYSEQAVSRINRGTQKLMDESSRTLQNLVQQMRARAEERERSMKDEANKS